LFSDRVDCLIERSLAVAFVGVEQAALGGGFAGEARGSDAEQADREHLTRQALFEDRLGRLPDGVGRASRLGERLGPVTGSEVGGSDLEFDRFRPQPGVAESGGQLIGEIEQPVTQELPIADIFGEGCFGADRLGLAIGDDLAVVVSVSQLAEVFAQIAELPDEILFGKSGELADRLDADGVQPLLGFFADAPDPSDRQRGEKLRDAIGSHDDQTVRLAVVAGELGEELVRRDADRSREPHLAFDAGLDLAGNFGSRAEQFLAAGHIQKRLIQAQRLDQGGERKQEFANLSTDLGVVLHAHGQENRLRAEPSSSGDRHRAVDAEGTSLVRRGTDHTPSAEATDDDRPLSKFGPIALLDGRIKGVHIDVQNVERGVGQVNGPTK
jgi:hypothetical protein